MAATQSAKILSEKLRLLRTRHDLTQESVAQMAGISYKYYQEIEAGRRAGLKLSTVDRLAEVFGIGGHQLFAEPLPTTKLKKSIPVGRPHTRKSKAWSGSKKVHC